MPQFRPGSIRYRMRPLLLLTLLLAPRPMRADSSSTTQRTITRLGEGIYEIRHPDAPDTFPQSNTTVIIGDRGVLVVDSCLLPSTTREDVEQIRKWTNLPVTYLVNTHWHFDHTLGNSIYAAAYPNIQIVAQKQTQRIIADFNQGAVDRYPKRAETFKKVLETGKKPDGTPLTDPERKDFERSLAGLAPVVAQFKNVVQLVPNVSFDRELTVDLGNRLVEIEFLGRGNTAGDTVVYLPKEKIVAVGDLLDHPVPYFFGGFPIDLVPTLETVAQLDVQTVVPGHGDVLRDKSYIYQVIDMVRAVNAEVEKDLDAGKTLDEVLASVPKAVNQDAWRQKFVGDAPDSKDDFDSSFEGLIKTSYNQAKIR